MILRGFCEVQQKDYTIDVDLINENCLEDTVRDKYNFGRVHCDFASMSGKCKGECSIKKHYENKR
jgi:hypothetical protein